jgi:biotin synthase
MNGRPLPVLQAQKTAEDTAHPLDPSAMLSRAQGGKEEIVRLLSAKGEEARAILAAGFETRRRTIGNRVYFRGIVELSNLCKKDCYYCGIRKSNHEVERFSLTREQIVLAARWAYEQRYGSIVLQAGERADARYVSFIEEVVGELKTSTGGELGITLSLGEQTPETYARWFRAGAHRYLLRIETSNPDLYRTLHPEDHGFEDRLACLRALREIGYQVGTGVMIGLPGQTVSHLADDVLFFRELDIDMIGMGPYVLHEQTPIADRVDNSEAAKEQRLDLALLMIAVCRLSMPDINIASTTALQALNPIGRELGLRAGANIVMPIITPVEYRKHYQLYEGKPCLEDSAAECQHCLERRIESAGDVVGYAAWGDSPHALGRQRDGA